MMKRIVVGAWVCALLGAAGCSKRVNACNGDTDCKDPQFPFCDVNGEYPASGGDKNSCTVVPDNCPPERCGCTAGAVLSCAGDQAVTCSADGMSTTTETCALGCAADGTRCLTFEPSNGLGGALGDAESEQELVLPAGAVIDTDLGTIQDSAGVLIPAKTLVVAQTGGPSLRAFVAHSVTIDDATVRGTNGLALVAATQVVVQGRLDLSAHAGAAGPGGTALPFACAGATVQGQACSGLERRPGAGGGGNATAGGDGGGIAISSESPLLGGCRGGDLLDPGGALESQGGGGGGAMEIVAGESISISGRGFIKLGGGGGLSSAGGGSGGTLVLEAPGVSIDGAAAGMAANGGSGGGCGVSGEDGGNGTVPATAPGCTTGNYTAGSGGTGGTPASSTSGCAQTPCLSCPSFGGGGGAAGRAWIATRDGTYSSTSAPTLSANADRLAATV